MRVWAPARQPVFHPNDEGLSLRTLVFRPNSEDPSLGPFWRPALCLTCASRSLQIFMAVISFAFCLRAAGGDSGAH